GEIAVGIDFVPCPIQVVNTGNRCGPYEVVRLDDVTQSPCQARAERIGTAFRPELDVPQPFIGVAHQDLRVGAGRVFLDEADGWTGRSSGAARTELQVEILHRTGVVPENLVPTDNLGRLFIRLERSIAARCKGSQ